MSRSKPTPRRTRAARERERRELEKTEVPALTRGTTGSRRTSGWRRTPADEDLLRFLTVHGVITLRQAAHWIYASEYDSARFRARVLEQAGLVMRRDGGPWAGVVLVPTLDGQTIGLESAGFPVSHASLRRHMKMPVQLLHRLLVAEYTLAARATGRRVISERQIRMLNARDEAETQAFLAAEGVRFSADGVSEGIIPGTVTVTKESPGQGLQIIGERPTWVTLPVRTRFDQSTAPQSDQCSGLRFPDALEVTETGELVALEVEISGKAPDRLRPIVQAYTQSLPQVGQIKQPDGTTKPALIRRQFRQVKWIGTPDVMYMLRGHRDLHSGQHIPGMIQELMPTVFPADYDWASQKSGWPVQLLDAVSVDEGLQYALEQRVLDPQYRCDFQTWKRWQQVWKADVPEEDRVVFTFPRWLRVGTNHLDCMRQRP